MQIRQYDQNSYLCLEDDGNPWSSKYKIKLLSNDKTLLASSETEQSRHVEYIGTSDQLIILVKLDYVSDQSSVVIDFYEVKNDLICKIITHVIDSDFTIGDTMIKVNKLGENEFIIMWSDLFNYNYLQIATVSKEKYQVKNLTHESIHEGTFNSIYATSDSLINMAQVIGHDKNFTTILFNNIDNDFHHAGGSLDCFQHNNDNIEFDSRIIDFMIHGSFQHILIKINVETRVDVLHLSKSKHYMLFKLISDKLALIDDVEKSDFEPSIAIINNKPKIFCSQLINKT